MSCILVIHQRSDVRLSLSLVLSDDGYKVLEASDLKCAGELLVTHDICVVIFDLEESQHTEKPAVMWDFIATLKAKKLATRLVAITSWHYKELVDKATQQGIDAFLTKPWKNQQVIQCIAQQINQTQQLNQYKKLNNYLQPTVSEYYAWKSHSMQKVFRQVNSLNLKHPFYVLSGAKSTGKKALAQYIHQQSQRIKEPIIILDCAYSAQKSQDEIWLEPLSFIGNGTLILQNIEQLSLTQQDLLVRYLLKIQQTGSFKGCLALLCQQKLSDLMKAELISPELYKHLKINEIHLPDLKDRPDDIMPFVHFMLEQRSISLSFSDDAEAALQQHAWSLNIKELALVLEKIITLELAHVTAAELSLNINASNESSISLPLMTLEQMEIALLKQTLKVTQHNIPKAAELLGLTKSSMYRRVEKYALAKK